jgi:hypothetical protein
VDIRVSVDVEIAGTTDTVETATRVVGNSAKTSGQRRLATDRKSRWEDTPSLHS